MHAELVAAIKNTTNYSPALQVALSLRKSLNKYYSLTDDSEVYHIAISMYHFIHLLYNNNKNITSSPPKIQAKIFQEAGIGGMVD